MKKTAVEWLAKNLKDFPHIKHSQSFKELIKQAKEMEKEQIVEAYLKGYLEEIPNPSASHYYKDMAEQYYKETYKSE
jgi:hypothetical protein